MSFINKKKIFLINSRDRSNVTDSDFEYTLDLTNDDHFTDVCLLACTLPKSYYMITADEYFTLTEDTDSVNISLPEGNYSRASLKTVLTSTLNSLLPKGWIYSITNPNVNQEGDDGKYTFNVTGNSDIQPIFTFNDTLYEQLGFDANSVNSFTSNSLKSVDVIKLQEDTLFIHSSITQSDNNNVLAAICTTQTPTFVTITWTCPDVDAFSRPIANNSSNTFRFYITNEEGRPIDFNRLNVNFTLMLYSADDTNDILKKFMGLITSRMVALTNY